MLDYEYDACGRITKVTETRNGTATVTEYTYDALGQLLTEKVNGTVVNAMTYDSYGNILTKNGVAYGYDAAWKDRLTSVGDHSITYGADPCNPATYFGNALVWEKGRQLKQFGNYTYKYNANGIRTDKWENGVQHVYTLDGAKILREELVVGETNGNSVIVPIYDTNESVIGITRSSVAGTDTYYFLKNLQGDIIAITDASGTVIARYKYDAWGKVLSVTDANGNSITSPFDIANVNPFRYRGYYYDTETGLYYLQSRYYDPEVGRFLNADDIETVTCTDSALECNTFAYCHNEPVKNTDPNGRWIQYVVGAALGGILNVVFYVIDCAIAKSKVSLCKALLNFLNGAFNGFIAAMGLGLIWQILAGIASGVVSLFIGVTKPTLEDFIIAVVCGILSGVLAGTLSKGNNKHINYLMKNFGKKFKESFFKSNFGKSLVNATKYVFKNSKKLILNFIKSYCIPNFYISLIPRIKAVLKI